MSKHKNILIGSRALAFWNKGVKIKPDTDWDIISTRPIEGAEFHDRWFLNNERFDEYCHEFDSLREFNGEPLWIMNPTGLAILKRSHLWRDLSFNKHITHYHRCIPEHWKNFSIRDRGLLEERTKMTMEAFPQGNPNLMQSKEDFFDDAVSKKYEHDYLHELVAFYDKPLYTRLLRSPDLAWCEKGKWNGLSHKDKIKCCQEEVYVIALERFIIKNEWDSGKYPYKLAYLNSLKKVCTTLCSGWFRDFAIDNYPELVSSYDSNIFNKVKGDLE